MNNLNQLIIANQNEITDAQKKFVETHQAIMRSGDIMTEFAISLAVNLKKMRDDKLYAEAGFDTFEDYTENAVGLKRRQAYNYIKVIETFGEEFVQSTAQKIGITKLELLTRLTEDEREQIVVKGKVEDESVKELKKRIKALENEREELKNDYSSLQEERDHAWDELKQKESELKSVQSTAQKNPDEELRKKIEQLNAEIKQLKNRPAEKEIVNDKKMESELAAAREQLAARNGLIEAKEQELSKVKKQLENAGDQSFIEFKIKFDELQEHLNAVISLLNTLSADKQDKCKKALKALIARAAI